MDYKKRAVEHYKDHELVCLTQPGAAGWIYEISVVTHEGDDSQTHTEQSEQGYPSEIDARRAGMARAKELVDSVESG